MNLTFEKWLPKIVAVIATAAWWYFNLNLPSGDSILASSLTAGAIFAGFLASCKAILMSSSLQVIKRLRTTGYIEELVDYLSEALWYSFALCCVAMVGFFIDTSTVVYGLIWIFVLIAAAVAFARFTRIMILILKYDPDKNLG